MGGACHDRRAARASVWLAVGESRGSSLAPSVWIRISQEGCCEWRPAHLRPYNIAVDGALDLSQQFLVPSISVPGGEIFLKPGDVLFNNTNSVELVGKTALVNEGLRAAFSNDITLIRTDTEVCEGAWIALALRSLWQQGFFAQRCNKWIRQAGFNTNMLVENPIPLPPLADQGCIVARVEALMERVREAKRLREEARKDADILFYASLEQVLTDIYANSPQSLPLGDFATAFNGRASGSGKSNIRVFKTQHVYPFDLKQTDPSYMRLDQAAKCPPDRFLRSGDVLMCNTARGALGRVCYVDAVPDGESWTVDTHVSIIRTNTRECLREWLFYYLHSRRGQAQILARERGTAFADKRGQTSIQPRDMLTVPIPLPSIGEQRHIVAYLDSVQTQATALKRAQQDTDAELRRLEQAILDRAFRGEL
jgi:type I restriction enzyme S subunit